MADPVEVMARAISGAPFPSARSRAKAQASLSALDAAGYAVVPKEPTGEMLEACWPLHHPWGSNAPSPEERPGLFAEMKDSKRLDRSAMLKAAQVKP